MGCSSGWGEKWNMISKPPAKVSRRHRRSFSASHFHCNKA
jgi:hypothetical protein